MAYSNDLRERLKDAIEREELIQAEIIRIFKVSRSGLNSFKAHLEETGSIERKSHGGGRPLVYKDKDIEKINKYLTEHPDATLEEIMNHLKKKSSIMTVQRALKKIGYRLKKNRYSQANRNEMMSKRKEKNG